MKAKKWEMDEKNEGMWAALKTVRGSGETLLYCYAPSYKELQEELEKAGVKDMVLHKLHFGRGEIIPEWSRQHPDNATKCTCACGAVHYIAKPDTRDWRKDQGL